MDRRPLARTAPLALALLLSLAACGSEGATIPDPTASPTSASPTSESEPSESTSESTEETPEAATTITLTREGDEFTPNGERVKVPMGEKFLLVIVSDEAGELHVHTTPEKEISYESGMSSHELIIKQPGVIEVESHEPAVVVLQLQAS